MPLTQTNISSSTMLSVSFLVAAFVAQVQADPNITGAVVDGRGNEVADAQVILYAPPASFGSADPVEVKAKTDAHGKFRIAIPKLGLGRSFRNWANLLASRPGSAIGAALLSGASPYRLVLEDAKPRMIKIEGPGGEPVKGARVALRRLHVFSGTLAEIPDSLAESLATDTAPDGTTTIGYVAARDQVVAVRISADAIGSQDFLLVEQPGRSSEPAVIKIRMNETGRLVGRVVSQEGQGVVNQPVEIWSRGNGELLPPYLVRFKVEPPRTDKDGWFQTPDNLMFGSAYRVAVRQQDKTPIVSDWITVQGKTQTLPPLELSASAQSEAELSIARANRFRAPVVFQTGDGPERTSTSTGNDGRFTLGGFNAGQAFVFVRCDGFRFHGQLVKSDHREISIELTRTGEQPAREMHMLADPIPIEESRGLARRLIEPCWNAVVDKGDDVAKYRVLEAMTRCDTAGVLERLERAKFKNDAWRFRLLREVVPALAERDFEDAAAVAESIANPAMRSSALVYLSDILLPAERKIASWHCSIALFSKPGSQPHRATVSSAPAKWPIAGSSLATPTERKASLRRDSRSQGSSRRRPIPAEARSQHGWRTFDLPGRPRHREGFRR